MEPVALRAHPFLSSRGIKATQAIFDCGNGFGLSVLNAKGPRLEHGVYCTDDTYEALLIRFNIRDEETNLFAPYDFEWIGEPRGWLTIQQVGELADRIAVKGEAGWKS